MMLGRAPRDWPPNSTRSRFWPAVTRPKYYSRGSAVTVPLLAYPTGETSLRSSFLPYHLPSIGEREIAAVVDTLQSGWLTTGPKTHAFEESFAAAVGAAHGVDEAVIPAAAPCRICGEPSAWCDSLPRTYESPGKHCRGSAL